MLAVCLGATAIFYLRLLSDTPALACRRFLRDVGDRNSVAVMAQCAAARSWHDLLLCRFAGYLVYPAHGLGRDWLAAGRYGVMGRRARDHRGCLSRHRVLAPARNTSGAWPPLAYAGCSDAIGDLHRICARRAACDRAVHGQRDAAAVRARALVSGQARSE